MPVIFKFARVDGNIHPDIVKLFAVRIIDRGHDHLTGQVFIMQAPDQDIRALFLEGGTEYENRIFIRRVCHGITVFQAVDLRGILPVDLQPEQRRFNGGRSGFRIVIHADPVAVHRKFAVPVKQHDAHIFKPRLVAYRGGENIIPPQGARGYACDDRREFRYIS